jgi:transcriptional regulator with XRE-family HTH domain
MAMPTKSLRLSGPTTARQADEFDAKIGARVKLRRRLLGMSQEELAQALGVSCHQFQKYEAGANRISATRLVKIANILRSDIAWLLSDATSDLNAHAVPLCDEIKQLIEAFYRIPSAAVRRKVLSIVSLM